MSRNIYFLVKCFNKEIWKVLFTNNEKIIKTDGANIDIANDLRNRILFRVFGQLLSLEQRHLRQAYAGV